MAYAAQRLATVKLPSNKDYWVKIRPLRYGDLKDYAEYGGDKGHLSVGEKLKLSVVEWNLDDEKGELLPVTAESIELLQEDDVDAIAEAYQENKEVKKNSSSSSTPTSAAQQ